MSKYVNTIGFVPAMCADREHEKSVALQNADWISRPVSAVVPSAREERGISPDLRRHRIFLEMVANVHAGNTAARFGIIFW